MGRFVLQALDSVGAQSHAEWEVLFVDDHGPEDGTREAVDIFARNHPSKRVVYIRNAENVGCGHTRNIAIAQAKGDFLALLDADDVWTPIHLELALRGIGDADLCFTRCRSMDEQGNDLGLHMGGRMEELVGDFPYSLCRENFLLPSSTVMRSDVVGRFGTFATRDRALNAADWDFYIRCIAGNARFVFLSEETCRYRRHDGAATRNYLVMTRECAKILRLNRNAVQGQMRLELTDTLHGHLCRLAYMKTSFRDWSALENVLEALLLKPLRLTPLLEVARGLRNNWKNLR